MIIILLIIIFMLRLFKVKNEQERVFDQIKNAERESFPLLIARL